MTVLYDMTRTLTNAIPTAPGNGQDNYRVVESYYRAGLVYVEIGDREFEVYLQVKEVRK